MKINNFIKKEKIFTDQEFLLNLARLLKLMNPVCKLLPIILILHLLSAFTPQIIIKMVSTYTQCKSLDSCLLPLWDNYHINLTLNGMLLLLLFAWLCRCVGWILFELLAMWNLRKLNQLMTVSLSRVRATWFDENPSGRVLNRLLNDFETVRFDIVIRLSDAGTATVDFLALTLASLFIGSNLFFLFPIFLFIVAYIAFQTSSIESNLGERQSSAQGLFLTRATDIIDGANIYSLFGKGQKITQLIFNESLLLGKTQLGLVQAHLWGFFWASLVFHLFLFFLFTAAIFHSGTDKTGVYVVFSAVFQGFSMYGYLIWVYGDLGRKTAEIRRVFEIVDLPTEETEERRGRERDANSKRLNKDSGCGILSPGLDLKEPLGPIVFKNYTMSYRYDLPTVIENLNLTIPYGKHVGIIGRTGLGKSSLFQSLLRMVFVHSGDILIGGQSVFEFPLENYRRLFGVVPQNPWLFKGCLSENLDPAEKFSVSDLKKVLKRVGLAQLKLEQLVDESGANFSQGQRQLLCLARCLLEDKPIILMDEPTSALDAISNAEITRVIQEELKEKSVLVIAHRLETLSRFDLVIDLAQHVRLKLESNSQKEFKR